MNSDGPKQMQVQPKPIKPADVHWKGARLPIKPDELERVARLVFVPRLEAIAHAMLEETATVSVKRGATQEDASALLVEMQFGRDETPGKGWTAYLVTLELDPHRNELCLQAGRNLHINRTIPFGTKDWEGKLIDSFEWLLSDSMRPRLRISS